MKTSSFLFSFLMLILLFACTEEKAKPPEGILPPAKMKAVLKDIHITEAAVQQRQAGKDSILLITAEYYKKVFKIHDINYQQYRKSFDYYSSNPHLMSQFYEEILTEISKEEGEAQKYARPKTDTGSAKRDKNSIFREAGNRQQKQKINN